MKSLIETIRHRRDLWKLITIPGDSAEIGVAEGYFSADILSWNISQTHYMVDRWACVPTAKGDSAQPQSWHEKNMKSAAERVVKYCPRAMMMKGESIKMAKQVRDYSLNFLYIDGDHSYLGVTMDLLAWSGKVKNGGVIALHDYEMPQYGVKRAVQEFCKARKLDIFLLPEDKIEDAGCFFFV